MELEQVLNQQKTGKFIKDEKENEGFIFHGRTLSKIKSKTIEETKKFDVGAEILSLAKNGEEISSLFKNNELFFFKGLDLKWRKKGKKLGIGKSLIRWILALSLLLSFATVIGLSLVNLWLGIVAMFLCSVLLFFFLLFSPTTDWKVYLSDLKGDGKNEIILQNSSGTKFIFLDQLGSVIKEIDLSKEGYKEGTFIKFLKTEGGKQEIWIRAKRNGKYDAIALTLRGITKKLQGTPLIEIIDWNTDGEYELASVSQKKLKILSKNGNILTEKDVPMTTAAYAGDLSGNGTQSLVILGKKGKSFILLILQGEHLSRHELGLDSLFVELVGLSDINDDGSDEILLKSYWEEEIRFLAYDIK